MTDANGNMTLKHFVPMEMYKSMKHCCYGFAAIIYDQCVTKQALSFHSLEVLTSNRHQRMQFCHDELTGEESILQRILEAKCFYESLQ
jgi:hypothetical protein